MKSDRPRAKELRETERFLWHLRGQWREKLDHDHWWKGKENEATQDAAVWEVLRRHPRTEKLLTEELPLYQESSRIDFALAYHGTTSWLALAKEDTGFVKRWSDSLSELPPQWGICRYGAYEVDIIQDEEIKELGKRYWKTYDPYHTPKPEDSAALKRAQEVWDRSSPPPGAFGGGASFDAFLSLSLGKVLIGFNPNKPGIGELVQRKVREIIKEARRRKVTDSVPGKSYSPDWLRVISQFEESELSRDTRRTIRDDQLFARYRRIISARPWPN